MKPCEWPGCQEEARTPRAKWCASHRSQRELERGRRWREANPDVVRINNRNAQRAWRARVGKDEVNRRNRDCAARKRKRRGKPS